VAVVPFYGHVPRLSPDDRAKVRSIAAKINMVASFRFLDCSAFISLGPLATSHQTIAYTSIAWSAPSDWGAGFTEVSRFPKDEGCDPLCLAPGTTSEFSEISDNSEIISDIS
jgi:hypothetical protein